MFAGATRLGLENFHPSLLAWLLAGLRSLLAVGQMLKFLAMPFGLLHRANHIEQESRTLKMEATVFLI